MSDEIAISVQHLHKTFRLPHEQHSGLKQLLVNRLKGVKGYEDQHVLKGVSFDIKKGEFFGIVGRNGSGKSTLLKLLAGIYSPEKGSITVNGSLTPFIELGVGFNPELTGRENVFLNGALLGFSRKEMEEMYDSIVEFAELEKFMDQKLKNYSSGMQVRLAFSVAIRANSDILLIDEVLAVGDVLFQKKCYEYFKKLKGDKKTVIFISHDTGVLQEYCDRGVLVSGGQIVAHGQINEVLSDYIKLINENAQDEERASAEKKRDKHIGSRRARVKSIAILNEKGGKFISDEDSVVSVLVSYLFNDKVDSPIYGITINDSSRTIVVATNTVWSSYRTKPRNKGDLVEVEWLIPNIFNSGAFFITPAVATSGGSEMMDQADEMGSFRVNKQQFSNAVTNVKSDIRIRE